MWGGMERGEMGPGEVRERVIRMMTATGRGMI